MIADVATAVVGVEIGVVVASVEEAVGVVEREPDRAIVSALSGVAGSRSGATSECCRGATARWRRCRRHTAVHEQPDPAELPRARRAVLRLLELEVLDVSERVAGGALVERRARVDGEAVDGLLELRSKSSTPVRSSLKRSVSLTRRYTLSSVPAPLVPDVFTSIEAGRSATAASVASVTALTNVKG